jgi:hypothetical protein
VTGRYAANTDVSTYRSREEIERTLRRYGADQFGYGWDGDTRALVSFRIRGRQVRLEVGMPAKTEFLYTPARGNERAPEAVEAAWEQACRQRWRALALVIKAKLEAVEVGISSIEEEFLAHMVLPGGLRVIDELGPKLLEAAKSDG